MNVKCPYCGKEYPEVSRYCPYCGSPNPSYKPKEEKKLEARRQLLLFAMGFIGFNIIGTLIQIIFILVGRGSFGYDDAALKTYLESAPVVMFVNSIGYSITFVVLLLIAKPNLQTLLKSFKNKRSYIGALLALAIIYSFTLFYSILLALVAPDVVENGNQETLVSVSKVYPLIAFIIIGIMGPVVEEMTYRVGLFDVMKRKNKTFAYVATIIIFTFIHFDFEADNLVNELLNMPLYVSAAFAFTYVYDKYGFAASLTAHMFNNISSLIQILI